MTSKLASEDLHYRERKEAYSGFLFAFLKAYIKTKANRTLVVAGGIALIFEGSRRVLDLHPGRQACLLKYSCHSYVLKIVESLSHRQKKALGTCCIRPQRTGEF